MARHTANGKRAKFWPNMAYRKTLDGRGFYCCNDEEIAHFGDFTIRKVQSDPPWYDVYLAGHYHILGTLDLGAAWEKLLNSNT